MPELKIYITMELDFLNFLCIQEVIEMKWSRDHGSRGASFMLISQIY
jgi:hypothetical protein